MIIRESGEGGAEVGFGCGFGFVVARVTHQPLEKRQVLGIHSLTTILRLSTLQI